MSEYDCLLIGYNDVDFERFVNMLTSMGTDHVDYKDLNVNYLEYNSKPYRGLDILTHFYYQDKKGPYKPFHNGDLLWTVIGYLGTYLHRKGFTFDFVNLFHLEKERLREKLMKNNYLTVAVTATIYTFDLPIIEVVSRVRKYNKTAKIIVGGPYISKRSETIAPEQLESIFKYIGADYYVCNREGEQALVNIINALKNNLDFNTIDNIAYKKGNHYIMTSRSAEINSLEENMVDYSLFPKEEIGGAINLRVSEGCPYNCSFCSFPENSNQKYKYMRVESIEKELDAIKNIGTVTHLFFIDGSLNVPKKRFKEMLRMMIRNNYGFRWHCFFRCDHCDEEMVQLMKESGCEGVLLGLESANETVLKNMNKNAHKDDFRRTVPLFKKAGIIVHVNAFAGFPGETYETFQETLDFFDEIKPDFFRVQMWYCDPVTPIAHPRQRERFGLKGENLGWSHNTMDAKIAVDLVMKAFMTVHNPIWIPDPGYNFVSLYHMERKGMSIRQQKKFLKCFNAVVKEKLLQQNRGEISPGLLESLKTSARFDEPGEPDMRPVEKFSGKGYAAAERFWGREFANGSPSANREITGDIQDKRVSRPYNLEKSLVKDLESAYDTGLSTIILAAYSTLLLRLQGNENPAIITVVDEKEPLPLRLNPIWTLSFREFLQAARQKIRQAVTHRLYAFFILTNPLRMAEYGGSCPAFETGYLVTERQEDSLEQRLTFYPAVYQGINLILRVINDKNNDEVKIQFKYSLNRYGQETIDTLTGYLLSILKKVGKNPDVLLNEITLEPEVEKHNVVIEAHAAADFNF